MSTLEDRTVVIIGGGSGIGLEVARRAALDGAKVHLGGRTPGKLADAASAIGATWQAVDSTDQDSLAAFFGALDRVDHLFTPGASYVVGPLRELSDADAASPFETKFWGQYHAVKHAAPRLAPDGSIVLMSGAASVRPSGAAPAYVACNAAIEGLGRGLAVELAPVRVNVVAPGTIDGNLWAGRPHGGAGGELRAVLARHAAAPRRPRVRSGRRGAVPVRQQLHDRVDAVSRRWLRAALTSANVVVHAHHGR